jgi:aryl sulfotransferase
MGTDAAVRYRNMVFDSGRWDGFVFRPDDILISTPPKCGTTWTQMMCALLIFQTPTFDAPLDVLSPWVDMLTRDRESIVAELDAQQHRRFIKSHTPLDGLPFDERVTYICVSRDPRDVALSWDNHVGNMDLMAFLSARQAAVGLDDMAEMLAKGPPARPDAEIERFWAWVDDDTPMTESMPSLRTTLHHLATFWEKRNEPNVLLLRYEDMQEDLGRGMRQLGQALGVEVPAERWPALVEAATFERMRDRADQMAPEVRTALWQDNRRFFNRGTSGQWRSLLDDQEGRARYRERASSLAPAELLGWVHGGAL